ncbi:DUF4190 domain-containing protein [Streptomyces cacaoi]|uniref:DUF4190 domain-containing protein n=1 Tax=Streptomyces cacaoi TaxID=1898 RepID=UPI0011F3BBA2|nr:DUF4190 domain-containing protein [Streptomyces cacaoi]
MDTGGRREYDPWAPPPTPGGPPAVPSEGPPPIPRAPGGGAFYPPAGAFPSPYPPAASGPYGYGWPGPPLPTGLSVASLVLGILSIVLVLTIWGSFVSFVTSLVGLCLGARARGRVRAGRQGAAGQATAGFVLGLIGLVVSAVVAVLLVLGLSEAGEGGGGGEPGGGPSGSGDTYDARAAVVLLVDRRG